MTNSRINSLRAHLLKSALGIVEDRLSTFMEDGSITSHVSTGNRALQIDYQLKVVVDQYTKDVPSLALVLLEWLDVQCPNRTEVAFRFESEILNSNAVFILATLPMTDIYHVAQQENGLSYTIVNPPSLGEMHPEATFQHATYVRTPV